MRASSRKWERQVSSPYILPKKLDRTSGPSARMNEQRRRLSMLSSMCQHVVCRLWAMQKKAFARQRPCLQPRCFFAGLPVCIGKPSHRASKGRCSVFRWLRKQRPRFAVDKPMIEQPKLVLVWMVGGRGWVCWVQCGYMWQRLWAMQRKTKSVQTVSLMHRTQAQLFKWKSLKAQPKLLLEWMQDGVCWV